MSRQHAIARERGGVIGIRAAMTGGTDVGRDVELCGDGQPTAWRVTSGERDRSPISDGTGPHTAHSVASSPRELVTGERGAFAFRIWVRLP